MKLNSSKLKEMIADKIKANPSVVLDLWEKPDQQELLQYIPKLQNPKKWKRVYKEVESNSITRSFGPNTGCSELDEQLVCHIETSLDDLTVLNISIEA